MTADPLGHGWLLGLIGSAITAVTFLAVAVALFVSLTRTRQWRDNPLGVGTFALFTTCGGGHLIHTLQLTYVWFGLTSIAATGIRIEYADWHMWIADGATAVAGLWYWTMRKRFPALVTGTAVYEDLRVRQRRALEIHDNVVQGLVKAKLALELNQEGAAARALDETIAASDRIAADFAPEGPPKPPPPSAAPAVRSGGAS